MQSFVDFGKTRKTGAIIAAYDWQTAAFLQGQSSGPRDYHGFSRCQGIYCCLRFQQIDFSLDSLLTGNKVLPDFASLTSYA
jgi:hypothetical protein